MRAVLYEDFGALPSIEQVADPQPEYGSVVVQVRASGICLSDWHGWMGHDSDITLPHVPGHELAGEIVATGREVRKFRQGDRVTVPFVGGCGQCSQCHSGNQQVCDHQFQPGFTHWGSFAELVAIHYADTNLVSLPEGMAYSTAASLGCRFATAFRAVVDQGRVAPGEWVAVHGCGGVGLSAIMIARARGAHVLAIDIADDKLTFAKQLGASDILNVASVGNVAEAVRDITNGGPHLSLDAIGNASVVGDSIASLRKRGRHVQIGLIAAGSKSVRIPMSRVIANELEVLGSHGMQAHRYDEMLDMIRQGQLAPENLIGRQVTLEESIQALTTMDRFDHRGVTVITRF